MPRFPVAFGRRKSTADNLENAPVEPSFRVLERSEVAGGKSFDGGARLAAARTQTLPNIHKPSRSELDDNIFADLKPNRGSGSSNTTKTTSTDNSSRHSNASTAPSSADMAGQEEWRNGQRKIPNDIPVPPIPKSSTNGFLKAAGRTFSFGGQKKQLPPVPAARESPPPSPVVPEPHQTPSARSRATTTSTSTTLTPPRIESEFDLDLGGDFGRMLLGNEKRASMMTLKEDPESRNALAPRSLTGNRLNQPSPIQINHAAKVEASPYSWSSHRSNEELLGSTSPALSPTNNENAPPPVPRHTSPLASKQSSLTPSPELVARKPVAANQPSDTEQADGEDEEARLLKDSLSTVSRFMSAGKSSGVSSTSRYRRNDDTFDEHSRGDDDSLFDSNNSYSYKSASRFSRKPAAQPQSHKVMTPAEFERYRKDKERQDKERQQDNYSSRPKAADDDDDEEDNYEDDEDDLEKARQQAKQRRKQEAHMAVYRQQMMKVTGEAAGETPSRPSLSISFSTPNLPTLGPPQGPSPVNNTSDNSDEDEEVPLAILAAHGFPNKNRPPTRLSTMMSNPNLRASQQPSYQRPMSAVADVPPVAANPRLPAFARNLPQDPFIGAGLVRNSARESFALGGGSPAPGQMAPAPPGGLIGVIANEERSRAMRRGSPHIDNPSALPGGAGFDPIGGIPPQMMYQNAPNRGMFTPGDPAQIQMTQQMQQMQQFMQTQMQFMQMQMMAAQNGAAPGGNAAATQSMTNLATMNGMGGLPGAAPMLAPVLPGMGAPDVYRHSFMGNDSSLDLSARGDAHMRTMSMVQPSSASWIQPLQQAPNMGAGFAPSIHIQGAGYAPSIAPSERSNIGLPGRYRPVSQAPPPHPVGPSHLRASSTMSGSVKPASNEASKSGSGNASDDDDEQGWEAMKAKREKKKSMWKSKKTLGEELSTFIS
ncbi:hypothetical protein V8F20_006543 [Naviculisporaceae sp. PSN 640]